MGRYRSIQSIMIAEALKGITDNQTIMGIHTKKQKPSNKKNSSMNLLSCQVS